jgi:hypothetical protein
MAFSLYLDHLMLLSLLDKGEEKGPSFGGYSFFAINNREEYFNLGVRERRTKER